MHIIPWKWLRKILVALSLTVVINRVGSRQLIEKIISKHQYGQPLKVDWAEIFCWVNVLSFYPLTRSTGTTLI
jgi:hypothetical protein